jgi:hypothetical protein
MADMAQAVSAAAGAMLTYWLGTLNRQHQENRENDTRWYEERLQAYVAFYQGVYDVFFRIGENSRNKVHTSHEEFERLAQRLQSDIGTIHFVGTPEVIEAAEKAYDAVLDQLGKSHKSGDFRGDFLDQLEEFQELSRRDLGHPSEPLSLPSNDLRGMSVYQKRPP